MQDQISV